MDLNASYHIIIQNQPELDELDADEGFYLT